MMNDIPLEDFKEYFKIGVSAEFILLRDDFPIAALSPGKLAEILKYMFERNDEVIHGGR